MNRSFIPCSDVNLDRLVEVWNGSLPGAYRIDAELVGHLGREHPSYRGDLCWALVEGGDLLGFAEVKESPAALYPGPSPEDFHLHSLAFRDEGVGGELLGKVLEGLAGRRIWFGRDNGHFWPGLPREWDSGRAVLEASGFQPDGGEAVDLEADLSVVTFDEAAIAPLLGPGVEFRRGMEGDEVALDRFFREEFPGRWRYDVLSRFAVEPSDVFLLWLGDRVEGFAFTQSWESRAPAVAGCVWRCDLGEHWGGLGPIGVSSVVRGRGFGGAVLVGALMGLQSAGVRRCIIDWTDLAGFYEKYGFSVTRRYQGMVRG